jgi:hypothetical protein
MVPLPVGGMVRTLTHRRLVANSRAYCVMLQTPTAPHAMR